jgi:hypothetical protein
VHPSAYRHILAAQPKPGEAKSHLATDSAVSAPSELAECFPNVHRLGR